MSSRATRQHHRHGRGRRHAGSSSGGGGGASAVANTESSTGNVMVGGRPVYTVAWDSTHPLRCTENVEEEQLTEDAVRHGFRLPEITSEAKVPPPPNFSSVTTLLFFVVLPPLLCCALSMHALTFVLCPSCGLSVSVSACLPVSLTLTTSTLLPSAWTQWHRYAHLRGCVVEPMLCVTCVSAGTAKMLRVNAASYFERCIGNATECRRSPERNSQGLSQ